MRGLELNQSKLKPREELTVVSGHIGLSAIMELFPFAMHSSELSTKALALKLPDNDAFNFENLNLKLDSLYFHHDPSNKAVTGIKKVLGVLKIDALNSQSLKKKGMVANFKGTNDKVKIDISNSNDLANGDPGYINLDLSESSTSFEVFYELKDIAAESLMEDYNSEIEIHGDLNAYLKFSGRGSNFKEMSASLKGNIEISSDSLIFKGIDLDYILKKYNRSQKFNLADVSAFALAGPFGAVVTKGADFTSLIAVDLKPEDKTIISKALARWSLNDGVLQSEDVAFRTNLSRIAFNGSLDIAKDSIPGFTVYVVDKNGCSLMKQTISGKTDDLQVGKLKLAKTLLGSVINAIKSVAGSNCEIVYDGEIAHPNANK
jgi:AsmA protein